MDTFSNQIQSHVKEQVQVRILTAAQGVSMIEIEFDDSLLNRAKEKSKEMGVLNNSIRSGEGNLVGFIGEIIVSEYLGVDLNNTYDYDLVYMNVKCDVKTKECTSPPKINYDCSIASYNTKQKCDAYIFVRVCGYKAWILGWLSKKEYFEKSIFLRKGQKDPSNNFTVKANCYNVKIEKLRSIENIKCSGSPIGRGNGLRSHKV